MQSELVAEVPQWTHKPPPPLQKEEKIKHTLEILSVSYTTSTLVTYLKQNLKDQRRLHLKQIIQMFRENLNVFDIQNNLSIQPKNDSFQTPSAKSFLRMAGKRRRTKSIKSCIPQGI